MMFFFGGNASIRAFGGGLLKWRSENGQNRIFSSRPSVAPKAPPRSFFYRCCIREPPSYRGCFSANCRSSECPSDGQNAASSIPVESIDLSEILGRIDRVKDGGYIVDTQGKGEISTGINRLGFRCVKDVSSASASNAGS